MSTHRPAPATSRAADGTAADDDVRYEPFDQDRHLGPAPWSGPALAAWEAAHGHDARVKCYPEFGCLALAAANERRIEELEARLAAHEPSGDGGDTQAVDRRTITLTAMQAACRIARPELDEDDVGPGSLGYRQRAPIEAALDSAIDQLQAVVVAFLRDAYPHGTGHPADHDADLLRARCGIPVDYHRTDTASWR